MKTLRRFIACVFLALLFGTTALGIMSSASHETEETSWVLYYLRGWWRTPQLECVDMWGCPEWT